MKSLNILRSECCFLFLEFILIWIAFASQNSSERLQLCHARILRLMVLLFDPSSVFFVRLRVRCGSIIEAQRYIGSLRIYGNRREDTVKGFGEMFPCLVLTEREERGLPCDLALFFAHCYRVMRLEVVPKLSAGAATERSGACDVAEYMSAVSRTVKALCGGCAAIPVSVAAMTSEQL